MPDIPSSDIASRLTDRLETAQATLKAGRRSSKKGDLPVALESFQISAESLFTVALAHWRMGTHDPRDELEQVLDLQQESLELVLAHASVEQYWASFNFCRGAIIQLLLLNTNQPPFLADATPPAKLMAKPEAYLLADLMDWLLLKALETGLFTDEWDHLMAVMRAHKKLHHVVRTYQTYRRMIQSWQQGRGDDTMAALREAEEFFARRTKDPYYAGGLVTCGGYELIPVVDYQLAAVIRVLEGFGGEGAPKLESIHRWRW